MSKFSKIIVGGCSFTDKFYPFTVKPVPLHFKMWPELLSDKTNIEVINTAKCGIGNERIFHNVVSEIFNNDNIKKKLASNFNNFISIIFIIIVFNMNLVL